MYGINAPSKEFDGLNKYIRITDISDNSNKYIPNPLTSPDSILENKFKLKKGDIVFARTGASTGKSYLYDEADGNLYFAGFLIRFHIDKANPQFIFYNTLTEKYLNWVSIMSVRSGQPGINAKEYKKLKINLPSIEEQNKIVGFISKIDLKIDLMEKKYKQLDAYKKKLIKDVFNQNILFKEDNKWKTYKFKELGKIKSGIGFKKEYQGYTNFNYNFYKVSDMNLKGNEKYMNKSNNTINNEICKKLKTTIIDEPALIFAKVGEAIFLNRKRVVIKPFLIDNNMMAFIPNDKIDLNFLYYLSQTINFAKYAQTGALPSYNASDIYSIKCKIPNLNKQHEISVMFSLFDQKLNFINKKIEKTKEFKKYLLQQMFV